MSLNKNTIDIEITNGELDIQDNVILDVFVSIFSNKDWYGNQVNNVVIGSYVDNLINNGILSQVNLNQIEAEVKNATKWLIDNKRILDIKVSVEASTKTYKAELFIEVTLSNKEKVKLKIW